MKRRDFLLKSSQAAVFSSLPWSFYGGFFQNEIKVNQVLGIDDKHLSKSEIPLEMDTLSAFQQMKSEAKQEGIDLRIVSGYRSFARQKAIWERKFKNYTKELSAEGAVQKIIAFSSIPGTSRHHWGTDIDLIDGAVTRPKGDLLLAENYHGNGAFCKLKTWLDKNSERFGFHLVYTDNFDRSGFQYEPWHYSYKPKSLTFLNIQQSENYRKSWEKLNFEGKLVLDSEFMNNYFEKYSLGINPSLMPS
ncbi:M15 family metallopeptidase [Psychroflexus aestuariivivens]|uniref:M15 family metallopeptidase n=1 Tax=Psychroflexus aestuariivivens TaxID=1795040 RepID=UPI000FDB477D|nr:M15 family metallopeptidase [Psychroflexus aestuariivivens]